MTKAGIMYYGGDPDAVYDLPADKRHKVLTMMLADARIDGAFGPAATKNPQGTQGNTAASAHGLE